MWAQDEAERDPGQERDQLENLDWDSDDQESIKGVKPGAKYGAFSESLRHAIPDGTTCSLFCGGKKCKYCNATAWKDEQQAVKGLYSSWITENILATARPSTHIIRIENVIEQFKRRGITSIICLQLPGEHSSCGHGLEELGFSYVPQDFMDNDVFFYNFGWPDYSVGSLGNILDMVKVMQFALSEGRVAIHCHAGLGRTGVLIACYLIFNNRMSADDVIHYIRLKRPGSIQTRSQIQCIHEFEQFLHPLQVVFSSVEGGAYDFTLPQYLVRQKHMLHGFEARDLKHIPKIVAVCCRRLLELAKRKHHQVSKQDSIDIIKKTASSAFNNSCREEGSPSLHSTNSSPAVAQRGGAVLSRGKSRSLESFTAVEPSRYSSQVSSSASSASVSEVEDSEPETRFGPLLTSQDSQIDLTRRFLGVDIASQEMPIDDSVSAVVHAMAETQYSQCVLDKVHSYKVDLNANNFTWRLIAKEDDAQVVAALLWDWLDHLKEPVLHVQDMPVMLEHMETPLTGLALLPKGAQQTIMYLFQTMTCLEPLPESVELDLIQRLLSTLTHQNMVMEVGLLLSPDRNNIRRTANQTGLMRDQVANKLVYFFAHLLHLLCQRLSEMTEKTHGVPAKKTSTGKTKRKTKKSTYSE